MINFRNISFLMVFIFFITSNENAYAQKSKKSKKSKSTKTVVIKETSQRVPSKTVTYKKPKKKVVTVRALPNRTVVKHNGVNYYHSNNKFYEYSGGRYTVITPKVGFRIKTLPQGYIKIQHTNKNYFWLNGIFYTNYNKEYEVVEPEIGTVIYDLPADYERVEIDGLTYYEFSNILYEKVQVNGARAYEVVGFIDQ